MTLLLKLKQDLRISFGLKAFSAIIIVFIPVFFGGPLTLSFAWMFGLFGWLISEPQSSTPGAYLRLFLLAALSFFVSGVAFNILPTGAPQICYLIIISALGVYLFGKRMGNNLGLAISFMITAYMAMKSNPAPNVFFWPLQTAAGTLFYALYSFAWDRFLIPKKNTPSPIRSEPSGMLAFHLAFSLGLTAWISGMLGLQYTYWALMTVIIVLREDATSTLFRARQRTLGTLLGCAYGLLLFKLNLQTVSWLLILFLLLPIACALVHKYYMFSVSIYTIGAVFMFHYIGMQGYSLIFYKGLDTLVGSALAVLSILLTTKLEYVILSLARRSPSETDPE